MIISDPGSEFDNGKVSKYCRERGIVLQMTPPRAKEMNGLAEKSVETVKDHARTMLEACGMSHHQWHYAVKHHAYLWNRTHIAETTGVTPYEAVVGREPSIMNVGTFGCDAFVHQEKSQRDTTFSAKAQPGVYLGHDPVRNCSVVRMLATGKIQYVKDVIFREGSFEHLRRVDTRDGAEPVDIHDLGVKPIVGDERTSTTLEEDTELEAEEPAPKKK